MLPNPVKNDIRPEYVTLTLDNFTQFVLVILKQYFGKQKLYF